MLPAKLARLICLLHLPLDGHHWNDDFRVCRNNVIHEFTTFFSHKQQFNDDDKSCKLEAEKLSLWWWFSSVDAMEFFQRQFFVRIGIADCTCTSSLWDQQWEQLIVSSVIPSAQFLFAVYISTEFRLLFFELRSNGIVKAISRFVDGICRVVCHKRIKTQTTLFRHLFNASIARISSPESPNIPDNLW